jgi:hypothetical protein
MEREYPEKWKLWEFVKKVEQEPFNEWKEWGFLTPPEREVMKRITSQERYIRHLKAA